MNEKQSILLTKIVAGLWMFSAVVIGLFTNAVNLGVSCFAVSYILFASARIKEINQAQITLMTLMITEFNTLRLQIDKIKIKRRS